ncbi:MAG: hypothetical protein ABSG59_23480, partial [Verrucomicrobiota bacterium]
SLHNLRRLHRRCRFTGPWRGLHLRAFYKRILSVQTAAATGRPEEESLLGTGPDKEIAARLNCKVNAVKHRCLLKGIGAWPTSLSSER